MGTAHRELQHRARLLAYCRCCRCYRREYIGLGRCVKRAGAGVGLLRRPAGRRANQRARVARRALCPSDFGVSRPAALCGSGHRLQGDQSCRSKHDLTCARPPRSPLRAPGALRGRGCRHLRTLYTVGPQHMGRHAVETAEQPPVDPTADNCPAARATP